MINVLYHAHSGLRYLVLLAGLAAVLYLLYAVTTRRGAERPGRVLTSAFVGLLDLQVLLGLLLLVAGIYYPMLMGHIVMMVLAVAVAHVAAARARKAAQPERANATRLVGVVVALALVAGGIMAIGRGLLETRAPMLS